MAVQRQASEHYDEQGEPTALRLQCSLDLFEAYKAQSGRFARVSNSQSLRPSSPPACPPLRRPPLTAPARTSKGHLVGARLGRCPNVFLYGAAISACEKGGEWGKAKAYHREMLTKGITPNVFTFSALISAMEKGGQWEKAETIFNNMLERGIEPDVITFNALISAMEKGGQWEKAETFFKDMLKRGIKLDVFNYSALFDALEGHGQHNHADRIFRNRPDNLLSARQMLQLTQRNGGLPNPSLEFKRQYSFELCIDMHYLSTNQA